MTPPLTVDWALYPPTTACTASSGVRPSAVWRVGQNLYREAVKEDSNYKV